MDTKDIEYKECEDAPSIILASPQLAENIGMVARAMANFGLADLRIVSPKGGWPKKGVRSAASGATFILDNAKIYNTLSDALTDLSVVFATTARGRGLAKEVYSPEIAMQHSRKEMSIGNKVGIIFGRERAGLKSDEISLAHALITYPVDSRLSSLNLAQAVLLIAYEWRKNLQLPLPFLGEIRSRRADHKAISSFFSFIETELNNRNYYPLERKASMQNNLRDFFLRRHMTEQDIRTLRGILNTLMKCSD